MTNWSETFNSLSSDELDDLAVLRIVECSNGVYQFLYRDSEPDALPIEETRRLMNFSMSSIKRQQIVLDSETIEFTPRVKEIMVQVRDLYLKGAKHGDDEAYAEFLEASLACLLACGLERLEAAKDKLFDQCYATPSFVWESGLSYCKNFMASSKI
jgi:hypothetical protein